MWIRSACGACLHQAAWLTGAVPRPVWPGAVRGGRDAPRAGAHPCVLTNSHQASSPPARPGARRRRRNRPLSTCTAATVASYGATTGVSIPIASSTTSGARASTRSPAATTTWITVPGIGDTIDPPSPPAPAWWAASSRSGGGAGAGGGRFSRNAPRHGPSGSRSGGSDSGGLSTRNAVVVSPATNAGWATSQRRNGRLVVTPTTSVSSSASRSRAMLRRASGRGRSASRSAGRPRPHLVAFRDARVDADPRGEAQALEPAGLREERARGPRRTAAPRSHDLVALSH